MISFLILERWSAELSRHDRKSNRQGSWRKWKNKLSSESWEQKRSGDGRICN